jgi:lysophospholipase L1-like esterase
MLTLLLLLSLEPARVELAGDWQIRVNGTLIAIPPPAWVAVVAERYEPLPVFNPKAGGWVRGAQARGVKAQETTSPYLIDPESFVLRAGPSASDKVFTPGTDYRLDAVWGTFGRLEGGAIAPTQAVYASYRHAQMRLDAVVESAGKIQLRTGTPSPAAPQLPALTPNEHHLASIYLPRRIDRLNGDNLFPVLETAYPEQKISPSPTLTRLIRRLAAGGPIRILAWGDSVTDGVYLPSPADRWQEQFVRRLSARYPQAKIELLTEAWGGRNTGSYLAEPPGSPHNYAEKVLAPKPDLIISEFVNDLRLTSEELETRYSKLLADFQQIGAEWIILTPHYILPEWMNLTREKDIDDDPRPFVAAKRRFAAAHGLGLADAAARYGRLWRQGIPHMSLMSNGINHPNPFGQSIFADALMALFP